MQRSSTLVFQLYSGREATPVPGATVILTDPRTGRRTTFITNISGRTPPFRVCAPPQEASLDPNYEGLPYGLYDAQVLAEGFSPVTIRGIQVFAGVESVVPLELNITRDRKSVV